MWKLSTVHEINLSQMTKVFRHVNRWTENELPEDLTDDDVDMGIDEESDDDNE